jgi:tetratricopeptide (TPR) repeat protein
MMKEKPPLTQRRARISLAFSPRLLLILLPFLLISCFNSTRFFSPHLDFSVQDKYIRSLPLSFAPLTDEEIKEPWGHEAYIGHLFTQKLDLYAAITALNRARLLIPEDNLSRKTEIEYGILYCYYLGKKYADVIDTFEESTLAQVTTSFPAFHDLLIILSESYLKTKDLERAGWILQTLHKFYPDNARKMVLSMALSRGDVEAVTYLATKGDAKEELLALTSPSKGCIPEERAASISPSKGCIPDERTPSISPVNCSEEAAPKITALKEYVLAQDSLQELATSYRKEKKSPQGASFLNALLPGAGYLYLGQKQSAFTSFCLNSLFIGAAYYFYRENNLPAAIITTGFEMGWYFGGIVGAKEAAILYNERLYEAKAHPTMRSHKLYPLLQLNYGF